MISMTLLGSTRVQSALILILRVDWNEDLNLNWCIVDPGRPY